MNKDYFVLENGKVIAECDATTADEAYKKLSEHFPSSTKLLCLVVGRQRPVTTLMPQEN